MTKPMVFSGLAAWLLAGCSAVADLDRFTQEDAAAPESDGGDGDGDGAELGCANPLTLCVRLREFTAHIGKTVSVDLVSDMGQLRSRMYLEQLDTSATADFVLPLAIPEADLDPDSPGHIEIWADFDNDDGMYDADGDHDWKQTLPEDGNIDFVHNSAYEALTPTPTELDGDFRMRLRNMAPHVGQLFEAMVIEQATGRTVGLYRIPAIEDPDFEIELPGIIDVPFVTYRIEFYADLDGDGGYDDQPIDHTWVEFVESNESGVDFTFEHGTNFKTLDYQFDFED